MADRYPLIANSQTKRIEELASGDNLNLTGNNVVGASTITAQRFIGDLTGTATSSITLVNAENILIGTISSQRLSGYYPIDVNFANYAVASGLTEGIIPKDVLAGTYNINITGTSQTANFLENAGNINSGTVNVDRLSGTYNIDITGNANSASTLFPGTYNVNITGSAKTAFDVIGGIASVTSLNVSGIATISEDLNVSKTVTALEYFGDGVNLSGIVTQITAGIGVNITSTQANGKGVVNIDAYRPTGKTIYVNQNGNDNNTGLTENDAKRTIKSAANIAVFGDTIKVYPGVYVEENPIVLKRTVSVEGTELRNCVVTPRYPYLDLFHVNNGCHITDMSFIGPDMTDGASVVALQPLEGVAVDRYFDAARMIRINLDYIANETVGFLTSGFSGFAGNHREQDAARLIDSNIDFIAAEAVGFLTSPIGLNFTVPSPGTTNDCADDIKDIFRAISYDLKANSNRKSVGAALSYFNNSGALVHITGVGVSTATIQTLDYAVGIAKSVIDNVGIPTSYQSGIGSISQTFNPSVIQVAGGCVAVGNTISQLVGIITSAIGAGNTLGLPSIRYGVKLESKDCADDIKDIWKCVIHDITRGGNSRSYDAGKAYYDDNWNLIPQILKNPGEVEQTIASVDYSFNIARSIVNNCTWGGYPVGLGTSVTNAVYDYKTGITTVTAANHGLEKNDAVKIQGLQYECVNGSPGESIGVSSAVYNRITGITTITTKTSHQLTSGMRVRLKDLVFECNSGGGPSTAIYPSGNYGYDFTVQDILSPFTYTVNVGISTLDHTYVQGGTSTRLYTPTFDVSNAVYDNTTGITTITTVSLGSTSGPQMYVEPGKNIKLENLVFECNSGGGPPSTAIYPSGALGYSFKVISTTDDRYVDASNLIEANRTEIIDKSLAAIAISHPDFYFPVGVQTTRYSRFKDAYRLIQQNKQQIINTAWNNTSAQYPAISGTQTKCKRDLGYFIDAVSTDIFTGGNSYSIEFVKQYFDVNGNPISNGLVGEEIPSNYAFEQARDLMKSAITNGLNIKDLTLTPDPLTGSNQNSNSCSNVKSAIDTLTQIVTSVISSGSLDYINSIAKNSGIFVLGENKCRRDIGFVLDALIKDIRYGTNKHIREAIRAYFTASGVPISNGLVGEEAPSITAFNAIRDYAKQAMRNQLNVKDLTVTADPLTGSNQNQNSCANVATNIDNLISILTTTINSGNLNSYPELYVSNKIKVNVGVSTLVHTYVSGGKVIANYTTNTFPDGTFNYIFPVHKKIDNNRFEFIGGKTNLPHTYVSGGTVQKYSNYSHGFTQVKDFGIQVDPETGFNNSINSCSNVISAIKSCVGVVTTIVGLGSTANIRKTYPGNSGTGISEYYDVYSATYDNLTGKTIINSPGIQLEVGDLVEVRDLVFECSSGGPLSTQKFPSGKFGYEFYVEKIYPNNSFEINVGISSLPHTYVSGGVAINRTLKVTEVYYDNTTGITTVTVPGFSVETGDLVNIKDLEFACNSGAATTTIYPTGREGYNFRVLDIIKDKSYSITTATYNNVTGIATIKSSGFTVVPGNVVEIKNLEFTCPDSPPNLLYPSGKNGYKFLVNYVNEDGSFVVNVGPSTIPHTYVSGGTVKNRTYTSNDTFTIQVGTSTIPHTYVSGGLVLGPYSKGVGPITQGPYVRNCTNFIGKSIGMKVDGFAAEPGDKDDIGVTGTMSVDSYTQYNQGGIGVSITNGAYAQLVSIFTICDDIGIYTESGGQCDITNSNCSFGNYGLYSKGVGDSTTKSIYRYTGVVNSEAAAEQSIIEVSGVGNLRPYDGQAIYFGELYYSVRNVKIINGGSGYTQAPSVFIDFPTGPNGIKAEAASTIDSSGRVVSVDIISTGSQYRIGDNPRITIAPPGGSGTTANAELELYPIYYSIESATLPSAGISTITLNTNLNNTVGTGTTVYFTRLSLQIATSISLEWVGSGTNINTAKPALGGVTIQENEVFKDAGGQVVYTSTNQAGNFQIGDDIVINQLTGTISGRAFSQSLLNTVTPLIIALGN